MGLYRIPVALQLDTRQKRSIIVSQSATRLHNERRLFGPRDDLIGKDDELSEQGVSSLQSVQRAIAILKSFSFDRPERGVGDISLELGLHKSTVSRLMRTLERGGLLARSPGNKRYRLGIDLIGLAAQVVSHLDVREVARPILRQLADTCQESVNLSVLDSGQVINVEQFVPPNRQVSNIGWVGRRMLAHGTAAGKVLLAYVSDDDLDRILPCHLERFTPYTITDREQLRQELSRVREQGYAVAREELEEGLNAIAAPVRNHAGQVIATVSVAGPAYRVTPDLFSHLAAESVFAADTISEQLGYRRQQGAAGRT
jgi:DNA-binding IclR family transcriptional regulator